MLKKYKWTLLTAGFMILLPMAVGLFLWNKLPDMIPTHFGLDNEINGWSLSLIHI